MSAGDERVLYEGVSLRAGVRICVTSLWCMVNDAQYPIAELRQLGVVRGRRDPLHLPGLVHLGLVGGVLVLLVVAIANGWTANLWGAVTAAVAGTAALTVLPTALVAVLRRPYEIWADYHGTQVFLFGTFNREQFGQVSRALVRAQGG